MTIVSARITTTLVPVRLLLSGRASSNIVGSIVILLLFPPLRGSVLPRYTENSIVFFTSGAGRAFVLIVLLLPF